MEITSRSHNTRYLWVTNQGISFWNIVPTVEQKSGREPENFLSHRMTGVSPQSCGSSRNWQRMHDSDGSPREVRSGTRLSGIARSSAGAQTKNLAGNRLKRTGTVLDPGVGGAELPTPEPWRTGNHPIRDATALPLSLLLSSASRRHLSRRCPHPAKSDFPQLKNEVNDSALTGQLDDL